ncbi:MAG: hypothetical protein ACR2IF_18940 [Terriglobales bacterium]
MKRSAALLSLLFVASSWLMAQSAPPAMHAPGGGTRETIASIFIPPLSNAPFSATVLTEWTRTLEDGSRLTLWNQRAVMRDGRGRIFQERRVLVPKNGEQQPEVWRVEISDPAKHHKYFCETQPKTCEVRPYNPPQNTTMMPVGRFGEGQGDLSRENLGTQLLNGVEAVGTRETTVLNAGAIGNDRPISITHEYWYSPKLGLNLIEKRVDPRFGTETFGVVDVILSEPDARRFDLPEGYKMVRTDDTKGKPQGSPQQ